ncbi:6-phosphogluconolactonase [Spirochaeta isovalerica]|uniref:6-phosphogluconolactonase n=1 Tax=Spirochaeta isovalerica TaxID=150 RepID=A0A841R644_9SPIO|nr:6-phosphogluconolactonase [Spirochaeta isovalerica]MBB6479303.1 6-phosphogluconolactonase [Spirochaeta isovalerica]
MMKKNVFDSKIKAAEALAEYAAGEIARKSGYFNLAVSGGSTPAGFFSLLASKYQKVVNWSKVRLFWVDERCVSPDHEESNYRMTSETLLDHIPLPAENVFRMRGEEDPEEEARRYGNTLKELVPSGEGIPVFDMILLGMGDDGHTASIFPDQISLMNSSEICQTAVHPVSGQRRITITGPVINKGKKVVFLVTGDGKRAMMEKIFRHDPVYPASLVQPKSGELLFYLDKGADPS